MRIYMDFFSVNFDLSYFETKELIYSIEMEMSGNKGISKLS